MPPKKKVAGDPGKGEKVFKNLCAVCHSLSVRHPIFNTRLIQLDPRLEVSQAQTLPHNLVLLIRKFEAD